MTAQVLAMPLARTGSVVGDPNPAGEAAACDVLIVDDEPEAQAVLRRWLTRCGYSAQVADDPLVALDRVAKRPPKVILLDLMMPALSGVDFLKRLRQQRSPGTLPVIVVSGSADDDSLDACLDAGANDYVVKPVNFDSLLKRLRIQMKVADAFHALEAREKELISSLTRTPEAGWGLSAVVDRLETSTGFRQIFGAPHGGFTLDAWLASLFEGDRAALRASIEAVRAGAIRDFEQRVRFHRSDDELGWALVRGWAAKDGGAEGARITGDVIDITNDHGVDRVAGVGSAMACSKRLETLVMQARPVPFALIDIDGFNELLGSDGVLASDEALLQFGQNLRREVRSMGEVYRISADEFAVISAVGVTDGEFRQLVAEIAKGEAMAIRVGDRRVHRVTSCAGVLHASAFTDAPERTLYRARIALKAAKAAGQGHMRIFNEELEREAIRRPLLADRLRAAIDQRAITIEVQPIVDLKNGRWTAIEALARWRDPMLGDVPAAEFTACADWIGASLDLTEIVADHAFAVLTKINRRKGSLLLCLNIAGSSATDPRFSPMIEAQAKKHRVDLRQVVLEVTEDELISDLNASVGALAGVLKKGAQLAIDDFGSGFSSLTYLSRLPATWLKLDTALLHTAAEDADTRTLLSSISRTAKHLGRTVVVEGVETEVHLEIARAIGAALVQGFHLARPQDPADFAKAWRRQESAERQRRARGRKPHASEPPRRG